MSLQIRIRRYKWNKKVDRRTPPIPFSAGLKDAVIGNLKGLLLVVDIPLENFQQTVQLDFE